MKKGQIIAIVIAVAVAAAVYLADRTPKSAVENTVQDGVSKTEQEPVEAILDAKVEEAVKIMQSGNQPPMVAVQMLKEVLQQDSNHVGALSWLGEFSMVSGQFDKAVQRFQKLLTLQPDNEETCIKLARAYHAAGNNVRAQEVMNDFLSAHPDLNNNEQLMLVLEEVSK